MTLPFPEPEDEFDATLLRGIQECGWYVLKVSEDIEGPGFAYTVGLWGNYQHPELIIFGLDLDVMHQILNVAGNAIREDQRRFEPGELDAGLVEGYSCAFVNVAPEAYQEYLGYARWLYRQQDFPALQCVWPDRRSYFPWQPDFSEDLRTRQPLLGRFESSSG